MAHQSKKSEAYEQKLNAAWILGYKRYQRLQSGAPRTKRPYKQNSVFGRAFEKGYQAAYRDYNRK